MLSCCVALATAKWSPVHRGCYASASFTDARARLLLGARVEFAQIAAVLRGLIARVAHCGPTVDRVCFVAPVDSPLFVPLALALPLVARVALVALAPADFASLDALRDAVRHARPTVLIAPPRWLVLLADTFAACARPAPGARAHAAGDARGAQAIRRALRRRAELCSCSAGSRPPRSAPCSGSSTPASTTTTPAPPLDDTTLEIDAEAANEVIVTGAHVNGALMDESYLASDENNEFAATRALDMSLDADRRATGTFGALNAHGALVPMPWWHDADRLDPDARIDVLRVHSSLAAHPLCRAARPFLTPSGAVVAAVAIDRAHAPLYASAVDAVQALVRECNADFAAQYGFSIAAVGLLWRDVALASVGEPTPADLWLSDAEQARLFAASCRHRWQCCCILVRRAAAGQQLGGDDCRAARRASGRRGHRGDGGTLGRARAAMCVARRGAETAAAARASCCRRGARRRRTAQGAPGATRLDACHARRGRGGARRRQRHAPRRRAGEPQVVGGRNRQREARGGARSGAHGRERSRRRARAAGERRQRGGRRRDGERARTRRRAQPPSWRRRMPSWSRPPTPPLRR
jgi:hypothetical protein